MDEPRVLLVDDDARVLSALCRSLRREPVGLETARDAREALERLASEGFDLVVSDQKMPGMRGIELLGTVRRRWPNTARILLSGWAAEIAPPDVEAADLHCILPKPWDDAELRRAIRTAVGLS